MLVVLALFGAITTGCGVARTYIEGYPVGARTCVGAASIGDQLTDAACEGLATYAGGLLEAGHAAIASVDTFEADYRSASGERIVRSYGTAHANGIVVIRLDDQTTHAFFVGCIWGPSGGETSASAHCALDLPMDGEH